MRTRRAGRRADPGRAVPRPRCCGRRRSAPVRRRRRAELLLRLPDEPNNVHLEVWLPGHLDEARLREAVGRCWPASRPPGSAGPPGRRWRRGYAWEIPPQADRDPVSVTNWRTEAELDAARIRFLAAVPPLDCSPPFRLLRARGPEGESLILNAHHAAFDGHSCLLLLGLIADLYSGRELPARSRTGAHSGRARPGTCAVAARALRRTARIAPGARDDRAPGYGYCLLGWPSVPAVPQRRRRAAGHSQRPARRRPGRDDRQMERRAPGTAPGTAHPDQHAGRRPPPGARRRPGEPVAAVHGDGRSQRVAGRRRA